jgi:hypothetical protein
MRYCLQAANTTPDAIDFVAHGFSYEPWRELFVPVHRLPFDFARRRSVRRSLVPLPSRRQRGGDEVEEERLRAVILEELRARHRQTSPFRAVPDLKDDFRELPDTPPQWARPTLVVEIEYRRRLRDGLGHASLKGVRLDKRPRVIRQPPVSGCDAF